MIAMDRRDFLKDKIQKFNRILNKSLAGWDIKLVTTEFDTSNPFNQGNQVKVEYSLKGLISRNQDKVEEELQNDNKEFMLCKVFVEDLQELINDGANLSINSLKKMNVTVKIDNGLEFQITRERLEGFNKQMVVLDIERSY